MELDPRQIEAWRRMSGQEKHDVFRDHMGMVRKVKREGIARQHPDWSALEVERELARLYLYGRS